MIALPTLAAALAAASLRIAVALPPFWSQYGFDPAHTGQSSFPGPQGPAVKQLWSFAANDQFVSSAVVDGNGNAYVGALDSNLYALNGTSGLPLWQATVNSSVIYTPILGLGGTVVVVTSSAGNVAALEAATGKQRWENATGAITAPTLGDNHLLLTTGNSIIAADFSTGAQIWTYTTVRNGFPTGGSGAAFDGLYVQFVNPCADYPGYCGTVSSWNIPVNGGSGSSVTVPSFGKPGFVSIIDGTGQLFYNSGDDTIRSGSVNSLLWSVPIASIGSPAVSTTLGLVYVGANDFNVYALNSTSGATVWTYKTQAAGVLILPC